MSSEWKTIFSRINFSSSNLIFSFNINLCPRWRPNLRLHQRSSNSIWNIRWTLLDLCFKILFGSGNKLSFVIRSLRLYE